LTEALYALQRSAGGIQASAIVSVDGLIIASALPSETGEDRVAAMSAAMLSLGERIAMELSRGEPEQVYVRGNNGYVLLMSVGQEAVLTVLASTGAKLGLVFLEMRRAVSALETLI
jgi:hypothetical protein